MSQKFLTQLLKHANINRKYCYMQGTGIVEG